LLPAPVDAVFIPQDLGLLERTRSQWITGDWLGLAALDPAILNHHPKRAALAAYVGAGLQQLGEHAEGKRLLEQAREWGCAQQLFAEVLLSGAYYTLARAALMAGDRPRAWRNLKESIEVGMPGQDVVQVARARAQTQAHMPGCHLPDWGAIEQLRLPTDGRCEPTAPSSDCDPESPAGEPESA
jgi:hypothetical protein